VTLEPLLRVDLLREQRPAPDRRCRHRRGTVTQGRVECITEGVGGIGGGDEHPRPSRGGTRSRGGGDRGLADTTLAGEQQHAGQNGLRSL
jgi:hypothetical protein